MISKKIGKNYLCYDSYAYETHGALQEFIEKKSQAVFDMFEENIILVLGGDGSLLRAIKKHHKKGLSFLGINFGTRGFLLNDKKSLDKAKIFTKQNYPLLEVSYELDRKKYQGICFNEANITVGDGKVLDLEVIIHTEKYFFRGDGVIVSTPAGSTGYNRSLHGPILEHSEEKFILTPKAEIDLKTSKIFSNTSKMVIKNIHRLNPIEIYLDGNKLGKTIKDREVEIFIQKSKEEISLLQLKGIC